jgi:excinuclease ABC subunit A
VPERFHEDRGWLTVRGGAENNLQDVDVSIPVGRLTCVTGVSGSGKSTLVNEIIYKAVATKLNRARQRAGAHRSIEGLDHFDKVIDVDQAPIGRTPRSNPATYTGLFDHIRTLYAKVPEARMRGYKPGRFSFNVKGGRCETCKGDGTIKIEMHFLPDVYVPCEVCHGKRYNSETLEVRYNGKSIADVLHMSVEEAVEFFGKIPTLKRRLQALSDVGLDYIRLGQPATTLSGGEAQRVKLATELAKVQTGRTLYILDEPTTGLHFADIERLMEVVLKLRGQGNTVLVIEHNLDVIKCADYLVDMGPEGGSGGGEVLAVGTPEQVAAVPASHTGRYLAKLVTPDPQGVKDTVVAQPKPRARKAKPVAEEAPAAARTSSRKKQAAAAAR